MKKSLFYFVRSILFYIGYISTLVPYTSLCIIIGLFIPVKARFRYFVIWNRFSIWWLKVTCGVKFEVVGKKNIPSKSFVMLSNHQSPWETIFLYYFFQPLAATLKKELLYIPFFGWTLALLKPIAIDRSKKRQARKMILSQGKSRLDNAISVLIFPEGTRVDPGQDKAFSSGGATLAIESGAKILPVAHNAGEFWPAHKFIKTPGTVKVIIGEPIDTQGREPRELTEQVRVWIKQAI